MLLILHAVQPGPRTRTPMEEQDEITRLEAGLAVSSLVSKLSLSQLKKQHYMSSWDSALRQGSMLHLVEAFDDAG